MYGIIATWRMALEGIQKADSMLKNNESAADSIEEAIKAVEDFEYYKSVGYGGLPNEEIRCCFYGWRYTRIWMCWRR